MTFRKEPIHVRKSRYTNHNAVIVGSSRDEYAYMTLNHSDHNGHHHNYMLKKNPDPRYPNEKSYLILRVDEDCKINFGPDRGWVFDSDDSDFIKNFVANNKKFKQKG